MVVSGQAPGLLPSTKSIVVSLNPLSTSLPHIYPLSHAALHPQQYALQSFLGVRHYHMALTTYRRPLLILLCSGIPESITRKRIEELSSAYGEVVEVVRPSWTL